MNDCLKTWNIKESVIFLQTVNKTTASQNVERGHKSSITVHPSLVVGHGFSRGLLNEI